MRLSILHTNDLHGMLDASRMPSLLDARSGADLFFDSGDCIKTGNLGVPVRPDPAWALLKAASCDASVIGNRETHILESVFRAKIEGASHPVLCANMRKRNGERPLLGSIILNCRGTRVGVLGVSVAMVTERMRTQAASAFLWDPPLETAIRLALELRPMVDVLFALTHIGHGNDLLLAESCPQLDAVFGGHSHTILESPVKVGRTWVCQGGSHARYLGLYSYEDGRLTGGLSAW